MRLRRWAFSWRSGGSRYSVIGSLECDGSEEVAADDCACCGGDVCCASIVALTAINRRTRTAILIVFAETDLGRSVCVCRKMFGARTLVISLPPVATGPFRAFRS